MSWLEEVNVATGVAVFGVATTAGVQYMKLRRPEVDVYAVVDVDAERFLALWRAHSESHTYDVAHGSPATWPSDPKWHDAADAFAPGRVNPVPLATVSISQAYERVRAPWWPPYWGRGTIARDLGRLGAGFVDGATLTIWLLTHGAASFPLLIRARDAAQLHRLAGFDGRGPVAPSSFFASSQGMPEWPIRTRRGASRPPGDDAGAESLHAPLLEALGKFKRACVPAGTLLFHGGRSKSPHADPAARRLTGTRKWFSEDPVYAVSYAFNDGEQHGSPLL